MYPIIKKNITKTSVTHCTITTTVKVSMKFHRQRDRIVIYLFFFPRDSSGETSPENREVGIFIGNSCNFLSTRFSDLVLSPFISSYLSFCLEIIQKNGDESPSSGPLTPTKRLGKKKERSRKYVSRNISETIGCASIFAPTRVFLIRDRMKIS